MNKTNSALIKLKNGEPVYYIATDEFTYKNGLRYVRQMQTYTS